jgi:DNA-binding XRE family transcriptional regulator
MVDSDTLMLSVGRDVETAYRFLLEARASLAELQRRRASGPRPVLDLKAWRLARGLTSADAAKAIGIGRTSWLKYEADPSLTPKFVWLALAGLSQEGKADAR